MVAVLLSAFAGAPASVAGAAPVVHFTVDADHPAGMLTPSEAFGLAFDGGDHEESAPVLRPANRAAIASAGAARGAYRLRTELGIEAWHWSALGRWSDPGRRQGYWTGDADRDDPAEASFGYRLPRRGDTVDEADNEGYSRIDDGDPASFWKSNPYLASTGEARDHPEWVKLDLGAEAAIDTLDIAWAAPFAVRYLVQYWAGADEYNGAWRTFPAGEISDGVGGHERRRLAAAPVRARFVRLLLLTSSRTAAAGSADPRDRLGFAVGELGLGTTSADGVFHDVVRHAVDRFHQTLIFVSSTDPWHRAEDLDPSTEQPSPRALIKAGVMSTTSLMLPVGVLYDTPENAAAELRYFRRQGLAVDRVELGEEPDGQRIEPEDYAALYALFVRALRPTEPKVAFGGPSLVNGVADVWLDANPDQSWTHRFMTALTRLGAAPELSFFSFEYYPYDDLCGALARKVADQPRMMANVLERLRRDGVPPQTPKIISELGLSAFTGMAEVQQPSAVFTADAIADFLTHDGRTVFLYGATPNIPSAGKSACAGRGNLMLWEADRGVARWPMPTYHAYRLLSREWVQPGDRPHLRLAATPSGAAANPDVSLYPLKRPDGRLSVLIINRGSAPAGVAIVLRGQTRAAAGGAEVYRYGPDAYRWSAARGRPTTDRPPTLARLARWPGSLALPPQSITVLRQGP